MVSALVAIGWLLAFVPGCDPGPSGRFVVVVVMDTMRRDAPGCYGGNPTPSIDAVAVDGVRFERAFATSGWTVPSLASLLTATWPTIHGALGRGTSLSPLRPEVTTVTEAMRAAGYRTVAFVNTSVVDARPGFDRGFDVFEDGHAGDADEAVGAAVAYVRAHRGEDCFILLHLSDTHPDIGRLVDVLKSTGVYERGFLVVTADHGEELGERGNFGCGHTLYDELVGVPLVIKFPSDLHPTTRVVRWQVSQIDVMPTILDYLGIDPPASFDGASLLSFVSGEPRGHRNVLCESLLSGARRVAWRTASYVYIHDVEKGRDDVGELYYWRTDPGERTDLRGAQAEIAEQMRDDCMAFYDGLLERAEGMSELGTIELSPAEVDTLTCVGRTR